MLRVVLLDHRRRGRRGGWRGSAVPGPPAAKRVARLEKARALLLPAVTLTAALLLLLLLSCATSPRCSCSAAALLAPEPEKLQVAAEKLQVAPEAECDIFEGSWVWDESYPLYDSRDCPFVDAGFRCSENGRPDTSYAKWRWQPSRCDLPRFEAKSMLERLRNKRVVFVGDSIGRNQWESILCMLSDGVSNKSSIYEINGKPITKHKGFLIFKFTDYNCTVEYYRSPFLARQGHVPDGTPKFVNSTVKVDVLDLMSRSNRGKWGDADLLIFNSGHWWTHKKTIGSATYFQEGDEVKLDMTIVDAYRRSLQTLFNWIQKEVNTSKTQVIFRTYSPSHFRGGGQNGRGNCQFETSPSIKPLKSPEQWADMLKPVDSILGNNRRPRLHGLDIPNVTWMTAQRKDGHPSIFSSHRGQQVVPNNSSVSHVKDCSHWCLPGIPDTWNELLYAIFMKKQMMLDPNLTLNYPYKK